MEKPRSLQWFKGCILLVAKARQSLWKARVLELLCRMLDFCTSGIYFICTVDCSCFWSQNFLNTLQLLWFCCLWYRLQFLINVTRIHCRRQPLLATVTIHPLLTAILCQRDHSSLLTYFAFLPLWPHFVPYWQQFLANATIIHSLVTAFFLFCFFVLFVCSTWQRLIVCELQFLQQFTFQWLRFLAYVTTRFVVSHSSFLTARPRLIHEQCHQDSLPLTAISGQREYTSLLIECMFLVNGTTDCSFWPTWPEFTPHWPWFWPT